MVDRCRIVHTNNGMQHLSRMRAISLPLHLIVFLLLSNPHPSAQHTRCTQDTRSMYLCLFCVQIQSRAFSYARLAL